MTEKVELKIQELKRLQAEEIQKKKAENIEAWNLTEKNENGKEVPIELSEEEYEALLEASEGINPTGSRNSVAKLLSTLSLVTLTVGLVSGIGVAAVKDGLGLVYFSICAGGGFIVYAILKGLAEAVKLLQQLIDRKTETVIQRVEVPAKTNTQQPQYVQAQPQPQQYQVTYTTANPPQYVAVNPQQYAQAYGQPQPQPQPQPQYVQAQPQQQYGQPFQR